MGLVGGLGLAAAKPAPVARGALSVAGKGWSSPARRAGAEGASAPARADGGSASLHVRPTALTGYRRHSDVLVPVMPGREWVPCGSQGTVECCA